MSEQCRVSMSAMANEFALTIDVPQIRSEVDGLRNAVEDRLGARVSTDADHYWLVELRAAFSADLHAPGQPGDLGVGQISDDIASVAEVVQGRRDAVSAEDGRPGMDKPHGSHAEEQSHF
jgi:hypothetical protein